MHPCPENRISIGRVVVYFARAAYAFSAGIKCRHSIHNWLMEVLTRNCSK